MTHANVDGAPGDFAATARYDRKQLESLSKPRNLTRRLLGASNRLATQLDAGEIATRAAIVTRKGFSRTRVTQIMNLELRRGR